MSAFLSRIWAITRITLLNTLRQKTALIVFALMLFGNIAILNFVEGDNTLSGQVTVVIHWSLNLISLLLTVLMIYLSSTVLDQEFRRKHILMLASKPVTRFEILVGKWLGLSLLSGCLLLVMGSFSLCSLYWVVDKAQTKVSGVDRVIDTDKVFQEILVSRQSFRPKVNDLNEELKGFQERLIRDEIISAAEAKEEKFKNYLMSRLKLQLLTLEPKAKRVFEFQGLPVQDVTNLTMRYRFYGHELSENGKMLRHYWEFRDPDGGVPFQRADFSNIGKTKALQISTKNLTRSGRLQLTLQNLSVQKQGLGSARIVVPAKEGLELLVPTGSFSGNYFRGLLLLWIRLLFLTGLGLCASTILRGQVTALMLIAVVLAGLLSATGQAYLRPKALASDKALQQHLRSLESPEKAHPVSQSLQFVSTTALPTLLRVLPDFEDTDPSADLVVGREISWARILEQGFWHLIVRLGLVFACGALIFNRRQLGLPQ